MATTVLSSRESVEDLIARQWVPFDVKDKGAAKPEHYVDTFSQNLVSVFGNGPEVHGIQGHLASYKQLYENLCYVRRDMHHYGMCVDIIISPILAHLLCLSARKLRLDRLLHITH